MLLEYYTYFLAREFQHMWYPVCPCVGKESCLVVVGSPLLLTLLWDLFFAVDDVLEEREERHIMRYRAGAGGRDDELEAESLENSSENSDGVESEGMSEEEGGGPAADERGKQQINERNAGGKSRMREANGKALMASKNRELPFRRKKIGSRREGKDKETSDSEEELAFEEDEKPNFNLLNTSLRVTYNGRPYLVPESPNVLEKNARAGSSSSVVRVGPGQFKGTVEDRLITNGESSRAGGIVSSNVVEEAFAPPSVIAAAAKKASKIREQPEDSKIRTSKKRKQDNGGYNGGEKSAVGDRAGSSVDAAPRNVSFKDLGGIEETLEIIRENIEYPLAHPELYEHLGVQPPRGVLLHGPPGCGKTMLANAIAVETGVPFLKVSAPEVVSGMSGTLKIMISLPEISQHCQLPSFLRDNFFPMCLL
jgi:hypothetical protein